MTCPRWVAFVSHVTGLNGNDDWPSFSKLMTVLVCFVPISTGLAITAICSAHGSRVLLALIASRSITVNESVQSHVDVWARRNTQDGIEETK